MKQKKKEMILLTQFMFFMFILTYIHKIRKLNRSFFPKIYISDDGNIDTLI